MEKVILDKKAFDNAIKKLQKLEDELYLQENKQAQEISDKLSQIEDLFFNAIEEK